MCERVLSAYVLVRANLGVRVTLVLIGCLYRTTLGGEYQDPRWERLVDIELGDVRASDLGRYVQQFSGASVVIDDATAEEGRDKMVSFHARQMPLATALDLMLGQIGWGWSLMNGRLYLHSDAQLAEGPLVDQQLPWLSHPRHSRAPPGESLSVELYDVTDLVSTRSGAYDFDSLIEIIAATVSPTEWTQVGGTGTLRALAQNDKALLVVRQFPSVHRRISGLFVKLRALPVAPSGPKKDDITDTEHVFAEITGVSGSADLTPPWWADLSPLAKKAGSSIPQTLVDTDVPMPALPQGPSICGIGVLFNPDAGGAKAELLAWEVVGGDRANAVVRALVWTRAQYLNAPRWLLTVHEGQLVEAFLGTGLNSAANVAGMESSQVYQRPPRNKDVYRFLDSLKRPWSFKSPTGLPLVAGDVRRQAWTNVVGETPVRGYPAKLARDYDWGWPKAAPAAPEQQARENRLPATRGDVQELLRRIDALAEKVDALEKFAKPSVPK